MAAAEPLFRETLPPYRRPTRRDLMHPERNGLVAASTFSGCGGSTWGLHAAGWTVPVAVEFVPAAAETYRLNSPKTHVIERDIRQVRGKELYDGPLDLLEGSPPCAAFTPGGLRELAWGVEKLYSDGMMQRVDDLFWQFTRLVEELQPRAFLAENVPGMGFGAALEQYTWKIRQSIRGYVVHAKVLNAANFGAPTNRRRLIFVGFRDDQKIDWAWPQASTPVPHTLGQALEAVPASDPDHAPFVEASSMEKHAVGRTWKALTSGTPLRVLPCQRCQRPLVDHQVLQLTSSGHVNKAVCEDGKRAVIVKNYAQLTVPRLDEPCPTLTVMDHLTHGASVTHPTECRKLTPGEAKSVMGFPRDFELTGTREQRYERMGRAVAPPMYAALGAELARVLS